MLSIIRNKINAWFGHAVGWLYILFIAMLTTFVMTAEWGELPFRISLTILGWYGACFAAHRIQTGKATKSQYFNFVINNITFVTSYIVIIHLLLK